MSLKEVLEPGIDYAENGHPIERSVVNAIRGLKDLFEKHPTSARVFLPNGQVPTPDEMFYMKDLAATYKKVVEANRKRWPLGSRGPRRCSGLRPFLQGRYRR